MVQTIHHSDRGLRYRNKEYVLQTAKHNIRLNIAESGEPYKNALAERMNRIIKGGFGMDRRHKNKLQVQQVVEERIFI